MFTFLFCPCFNSFFTHSLLGQMRGTRNMKEMEELHCSGSLEFSGRNSECERIKIEWGEPWSVCTQHARAMVVGRADICGTESTLLGKHTLLREGWVDQRKDRH